MSATETQEQPKAFQPNRLFDNEAEILATYPGAKIIRTWPTNQIACEIIVQKPDKKKVKK